MSIGDIRLHVVFFRTESGSEPVRRWLRSLPRTHKKAVGEDIKTVQFGWPLGMPLVEKIAPTYGRCAQKSQTEFLESYLPLMVM